MLSDNARLWLGDYLSQTLDSKVIITCIDHHFSNIYFIDFKLSLNVKIIHSLYQIGYADLPCSFASVSNIAVSSSINYLPCLGATSSIHNLFHRVDDLLYWCDYDFLGFIFRSLALLEEVDPPNNYLDNFNRFKSYYSQAERHGYLQEPWVDQWLLVLKLFLNNILNTQFFDVNIGLKIYPSHDVDVPIRFNQLHPIPLIKSMGACALKDRLPIASLLGPYSAYRSKTKFSSLDPYNTFNWIIEQGRKLSIPSTFYFMSHSSNLLTDASYTLKDTSIICLIKTILNNSHHLGLHPSFYAYNNKNLLEYEVSKFKASLSQIIPSSSLSSLDVRMHVLRFSWPKTAVFLDQLGVLSDSSVYFASNPGFRLGTSKKFKMFDPVSDCQLSIYQKPLSFMECSLLSQKYLGVSPSSANAYNYIDKLAESIRSVNGEFHFLWHNNYLVTKDQKDLYLHLISQ